MANGSFAFSMGGPSVESISVDDLNSLPTPLVRPAHVKGAFKAVADLWQVDYLRAQVFYFLILEHVCGWWCVCMRGGGVLAAQATTLLLPPQLCLRRLSHLVRSSLGSRCDCCCVWCVAAAAGPVREWRDKSLSRHSCSILHLCAPTPQVQDFLEVEVDRIPECYSCIPDTKSDRIAARVQELTMRFHDLLEVAGSAAAAAARKKKGGGGGGALSDAVACSGLPDPATDGAAADRSGPALAAVLQESKESSIDGMASPKATRSQSVQAPPTAEHRPTHQPHPPPPPPPLQLAPAPPPAPAPATCRKCKYELDPSGGGEPCPVCGSVFRGDGEHLFLGRVARPAATAAQLEEPGFTYYMQQQSLGFGSLFPRLHADLNRLAPTGLSGRMEAATASVGWFGTGVTQSQLHKDRKDNIICQATGGKDIMLFAPAMEQRVYPRDDTDGTHFNDRYSQMQFGSGNDDTVATVHQKFPLAASAKGTVVHVAAGDALLIPSGWWHRVDSTVDSDAGYHFMVNTFFDTA